MAKRASLELRTLLDTFLERNAARMSAPLAFDAKKPSGAFPDGAVVADDVPPSEVLDRLAQLTSLVAAQVKAGEIPRIDVPDLHRVNALFDDRGNVFIGRNVRPLAFDGQTGHAFMGFLLTLELAAENLRTGACTTKRGVYYQHRNKLPREITQTDTDRWLSSLASVLRVRRRALGFVEAPRGSVHGRLVLRDGGEVVDVAKLGPTGRTPPRFTDDVEIVSSDATTIVIIEKEAIASRLARADFCDKARCIMISDFGSPSLSAREFTRTLADTLRLPVVIFADGDPAGIQIALTHAHGSISTAPETPWLACEARWAGFCPSDYDRHAGRSDEIKLRKYDVEKARTLIEHPSRTYVNDRVRAELSLLVDRGFKVELDGLARDTTRLTDYVRHKMADGDLITL